ncbi:protein toll-like [Trichoplusia ni]|uniref:Protein toll-like n=1 Tax=Trichoplusia ni TaxID=7111 RepID=A0A7E5V8F8_TRINI|nr:protein toll-like [Trichoplusia ni]XP_026724544.1 protein toll-like [Trichoplusia ni]
MRILLLAVLLGLCQALPCPRGCSCGAGDELEYYCPAGRANVSIATRTNDYVNVRCIGTNFTCSDLPIINLANNLTLPSLGVTNCSPSFLRCIRQALQASSVVSMVMTGATEGMQVQDLENMTGLQSVMIKMSPEKTIPVAAISTLKNLNQLRITYSNIKLESNAFINTPPIKFLELSSDKITEIPENAFQGLKSLTTLNIWGNNFSHVGENSFKGLDSLEDIALNTNHIKSIDERVFQPTPRLKTVLLMANVIEEIPSGLFNNLEALENITIRLNFVQLKLQPQCLSNLTSLKNIVFQQSYVQQIPEDFLKGSTDVRSLVLNRNQLTSLPEDVFRDQKYMEILDLSYNKIAELKATVFTPLKQLRTLNLNRNYLEVLPESLFAGLRHLTTVSIDNNFLTTIYPTAFLGATGLTTLTLTSNNLTLRSKDFGVYSNFIMHSPFGSLNSLKYLGLRDNKIDSIFDDWRNALLNLEILDLSKNKFSILDMYDIQFLGKNITVDLRNNEITTLELSYVSPPDSTPSVSKSSGFSILLDGNPFNCDCGLYPLALRLLGGKPLTVEPKFVVGNARCASPPHLQGKLFSQLSPSHLNCDLPEENCPEQCSKCIKRPAFDDIDLECLSIPNLFPNSEDFGAKYFSLKVQKITQFYGNLSLNLLNISNIGLDEIPFEPSSTIKVLDFSKNNLKKIPIDFLESDSKLYLSGNPFECDCWSSNDIALLQKSDLVLDLDQITCRNGDRLLQVDIVALCSTWRAAAVASGVFITMLALFFFVALTMYIYSHEILIYIIDHGLFPCCFKDDLTDIDKEFDVFISFAHKDRNYLRELLPKIENDFGQKTCLHYRDWYAGDLIPTQIKRSVENSRKTLILLSRNFLESHYANMEFQAAHNLALNQGKTRVILILLEDVSKSEKLSDELKAYMSTNTYLTWDDPRFYERLQKALPRRMKKKFVFPEVFKNEIKSGLDVHLNSDGKLVNIAVKDT